MTFQEGTIIVACVFLVLFVEKNIIKWFFNKIDECNDAEGLVLVILLIFSVFAVLEIIIGIGKSLIDHLSK